MSKANAARSVRDLVLWGRRRLAGARLSYGHGTDNPLDEAAWIVASTLDIPFAELDARADRVVSDADQARIAGLIETRIHTRKPAAYLLHEAWFAGLKFYVDERVLVPRSLVAEFILDGFQPWIDPLRVRRALDLCTGSGCIAIALAQRYAGAQVDAADISPDALAVARINVDHYGLGGRLELIESDLFDALAGRRYDLIVTNPPYVDADDMAALPAEYRHEPALGLASGPTGLDAVTRILAQAADHLEPDGILVAEVGNSNVALAGHFPQVAFTWLSTASGDESVFMLNARQLRDYQAIFRGAVSGG